MSLCMVIMYTTDTQVRLTGGGVREDGEGVGQGQPGLIQASDECVFLYPEQSEIVEWVGVCKYGDSVHYWRDR